MKIGIDARCLQDGEGSGVAVFARGLLRAMFRVGAEHSFVLLTNSFRSDESVKKECSGENVVVRSYRIPNKFLHASEVLFRRPLFDSLMGDVDAVFMPNIHFASFSAHIPLVVALFDMSYKSHSDLLSARSRLWHWVVNPGRLARRSEAVVTISNHSKATIEQYLSVSPDKIHVVYPGVEKGHCEAGDRSNLPPYVLVLSDLEPRKNILSILRAFEQVKKTYSHPLKCVIVGRDGWNASYVKKLRDVARRIPDVQFRGYVREGEKWELLRGARALLYVSYEEGFGFPPLEAMSVGTPVVASSLASLPEVLGDAAMFVNSYDVTDIAQGLTAVLTDNALCRSLRARGYERVTRYSWDTAARKILDIFVQFHR